jgi:hypothetical protein
VKYFRIRDSFNQGRWYLGSPRRRDGREVDPRLFTSGQQYTGEGDLEINVRQGRKALDFTLASFDMPVIAPGLANRLQVCCGHAIQLIAANVSGMPVAIMNVLQVLDGIHETFSEITWWSAEDGLPTKVDTYAAIGKLVLRRERLQGAKIFRLKNWELPLIVSETVKDLIEDAHATGIGFQELDSA